MQLALPAQVIWDWHADWTDLTEKADYTRSPMWHTKNGKDGNAGGTTGPQAIHHAKNKKPVSKKESKKESKKSKSLRRNSSFESPDIVPSSSRGQHEKHKGSKMSRNTQRTKSKLSSVADGPVSGARRQSLHRGHSILGSAMNSHRRLSTAHKNISPTLSSFRANSNLANKLDLANSRVVNSQNSAGYSLNYQLSSKLFREKGWTVLQIDPEEADHHNEKSILTYLAKSLHSM